MLYACYAMFGLSLLGTVVLLPGIWTRLVHDKLAPIVLTPTLFLVLGPLGQSTTAVGQIADAAGSAAPPYAAAMGAFAVLYGVPVMGYAMLWLAVAVTANARALRRGMPFALTWWAYTFPVGTCVTGAAALAGRTGLGALTVHSAGAAIDRIPHPLDDALRYTGNGELSAVTSGNLQWRPDGTVQTQEAGSAPVGAGSRPVRSRSGGAIAAVRAGATRLALGPGLSRQGDRSRRSCLLPSGLR
jgi:hypothetical protein